MSRAESKVRTLGKLRSAGREVLLEMGVQTASIQDITKRAGVAVGSFYVHFESKAELVDSLVSELNQGLLEAVMGALATPPLPKTRVLLRTLVETVATYWAKHYTAIPLFADHLARHANEEILRIGTNPGIVAFVKKLLTAVPEIRLSASPEFSVAMLVATWRAFGLFVGPLKAKARKRAIDDFVRTNEALLTALAPGILDVDPNHVVETMGES